MEPRISKPRRGELTRITTIAAELRKTSRPSIDVDVGLVVVQIVGIQVRRTLFNDRRLDNDRVGDLRHLFEIPTCWTEQGDY